jgi:peroxiredoxin
MKGLSMSLTLRASWIFALVVAFAQCGRLHAQTRRDVTTLSSAELRAYRDAFRAIQESGKFAELAGYHGCPDFYCHNESPYRRFLPWHRAYARRFEEALQDVDSSVALHYWDWTSSDSETNGLPDAFTDTEYTSGGMTYPNPLRRFRFDCDNTDKFTERFPDQPFLLQFLRNDVEDAFLRTTYDTFNANSSSPVGIQRPHGSLHGWVGGEMGSTTFAAYDPVFWAHHSNVDRQWAMWQDSPNGAEPSNTIKNLPLEPFGLTVGEVLDYRAMGYDYDSPVPGPGPFAFTLASTKGKLLLKNLSVPKKGQALGLFVDALPEHPEKSVRVYVFVNQPDATIRDVKPDNPNLAGYFAIFGGEGGKHDALLHAPKKPVRVLDLAPAVRRLAKGKGDEDALDVTVSLVTADTKGKPVDVKSLPFKQISVKPEEPKEKADDDNPSSGTLPPTKAAKVSTAVPPRWTAPLASRLKKFRGDPVVIVLFKGLQCAHCVEQLDAFASRIANARAHVLFVSAEDESTAKYGAEAAIEILSDPNHEVFHKFRCFDSEPLHGTFILDKDGNVAWRRVGETPFMDVDRVLAELAELG